MFIRSVFISFLFLTSACGQELKRFQFEHPQMGTLFRIILYAENQQIAEKAANAAFQRIDSLNQKLSDYLEDSELNKLPVQSGDGTFVPVSSELYHVIREAQHLARQSNGAFDITVGPYVRLWRALNRQTNPRLPEPSALAKAGQSVGFQYITLDTLNRKVALTRPDMQLDLGGIAKGFTSDEVLKVLQTYGIESALVDAGGDITAGEAPPGNRGWRINVPSNAGDEDMDFVTYSLRHAAIATSGDLFNYVIIDGERYSHIIDPQTGLGLTNRSMVTVIAPDGITADCYASAISVLGPQQGIKFIQSKPGIEARFVYGENSTIRILESPGFEKRYLP